MADVEQPRGQLVMVAALGLAVLFVVLALVLNTAIFTETLATQENTIDDQEVAGHQDDVRRATADVIAYANQHNNSSYASLDETLSNGTTAINRLTARHAALDGRATHVSLVTWTRGARITQNNVSDFTDDSGTKNWTLAADVSETEEFRLNVTRDGLVVDDDCAVANGNVSTCFRLEVTDGSQEWLLAVHQNSNGEILVGVNSPSDDTWQSCDPVDSDSAVINLTAGTVAGQSCGALTFAEGISSPYSIAYTHGTNVTGTYDLTVGADIPSDSRYDASGDPHRTPLIHSTTVAVTYNRSDMNYATQIQAPAGETDD